MNFTHRLVGGEIIGWLASITMRSPEGILLNIFVGIVGVRCSASG